MTPFYLVYSRELLYIVTIFMIMNKFITILMFQHGALKLHALLSYGLDTPLILYIEKLIILYIKLKLNWRTYHCFARISYKVTWGKWEVGVGMGKCVTNAVSTTDWPHLVASTTICNEANQWYTQH